MKTTPRRPRSDSAKAAIAAVQSAALGPIAPPKCVTVGRAVKPFWNAIVTARPRDTWTEADLILAGSLARDYAAVEQLREGIEQSGLIIGDKVNPACDLLDKISRRALATARQLKVDTIATVGKAQDIHQGAKLEREARGQMDDDLIPRMSTLQ